MTEDMSAYITSAEKDYIARVGGVVSTMLELTYKCSTKCIHCYNVGATRNDDEVSYRGDREELNLEDYIRIIDELYELGLTKVCLSGGDPFSNPYAWDIIEYLYIKGIAFDIYTNGVALKGKEALLAKYYPHFVGISVYSNIPEIHDSITRVTGSFDRTINVVENLSNLAILNTVYYLLYILNIGLLNHRTIIPMTTTPNNTGPAICRKRKSSWYLIIACLA